MPQWYHRQLAIHNCAISKDDTDAVTGICRRFQCVIVITDGAIIFISLTPAEFFGQCFFDFRTRCQCIDQLVFQYERLRPAFDEIQIMLDEMNDFRLTPTGTLKINAARVAARIF